MILFVYLELLMTVCQRRDDPYGRIKRSQARTGKGNWRKTDYSKDVSGGLTIKNEKGALRMQGVFSVEIQDLI